MSFFDDFEEVEAPIGSNWRQTLNTAPSQPQAAPIRPAKSAAECFRDMEAEWARDVASPQNGYPSLQQSSSSSYQPCNFGNVSTVRNIAGNSKRPKLEHQSQESITIDDNSDNDIACTSQSLPSAAPSPRANPASQVYNYSSNGGFQQYVPRASTSQSPFGAVPMISGSTARLPSQAISRSQQPAFANPTEPKQNSKKRKGDVVDLTLSSDDSNAGSVDSDLQITGSKEPSIMIDNSHQFLGQISSVVLILHPVPELNMEARENQLTPPPLPVSFNRIQPVSVPMQKPKESVYIVSGESGQRFGALEARVADVLGPVFGGKPCMDGRVVIRGYAMRPGKRPVTPTIIQLIMLVFSVPSFIKPLSDHLAKNSLWLEAPTLNYQGPERYNNPHNPQFRQAEAEQRRRQMMSGLNGGSGFASTAARAKPGQAEEQKRQQIESVFSKMSSGADIETVEPDDIVTTQLYAHQKQALAFLIDRERLLPLPEKNATEEQSFIALWQLQRGDQPCWVNAVTGVMVPFSPLRPVLPPQCRGSILADDMGLGKTACIISLVASSRQAALDFMQAASTELGKADDCHSQAFDALKVHPISKKIETSSSLANFETQLPFGVHVNSTTPKKKSKKAGKKEVQREEAEAARKTRLRVRSKATLIVCPLSTVQNWEAQIKEHVKGGQLKVYIYHGPGRTSDCRDLSKYDVVITTFSTVGSEYSKQCKAEEKAAGDAGSSGSSDVEALDSTGSSISSKKSKPARKSKAIEGADNSSILQRVEWFRIVLDEAHMIKEHTTIQARACCDLSAERRVCLSGTPLQNSLNDLFSLVKFLRFEPFTDRSIWTQYIGAPAKAGDQLAVSRLQLLVRHVALRRTKQTTDANGKPILDLPPKKDLHVFVDLDEQEKAFYTSHHHRYKSDFLANSKSDTLMKNYASILQELLRLRQICVHMALVQDSEDAAKLGCNDDPVALIQEHGISKSRAVALFNFLRDTDGAQCGECGGEFTQISSDATPDIDPDVAEGQPKRKGKKPKTETGASQLTPVQIPVLTRCTHIYCLQCFQSSVCSTFPRTVTAEERATCRQCQADITPVADAIALAAADLSVAPESSVGMNKKEKEKQKRTVQHSSKIRVLLGDLLPFSQANPMSDNHVNGFGEDPASFDTMSEENVDIPRRGDVVKSVIFSQWTKLLDRVGDALDECNIQSTRLDGSMKREDRNRAMETFGADPRCEVLLVSLRAGGMGLNLTMANRVYLMEPFWNPAVENQATDRIHRLGQRRPVKITRYIVRDSIEQNMLEIQKRKTDLANLSVGQTLTKKQLAERRVTDLKILFK